MDNVKCGVVRDLLPLVVDEVASPDSVELVNAHMETCEVCRSYYEGMTAAIARTNAPKSEEDTAFIKLGKKIRFQAKLRKWLTIALAALLALAILFTGYAFVNRKMSVYAMDMDPDWADVQLYHEPNGAVGVRIDMRDGHGWYNCMEVFWTDGIVYLMPRRPEWTWLNKGRSSGENFPLHEYCWQDGKIYWRIPDGDIVWNPEKNLWEEAINEILRPVYTVRWGTMENYTTLYVEGEELPGAIEVVNAGSERPVLMTGIEEAAASDQTIIVKEDAPAEAEGVDAEDTLGGAAPEDLA